MITKRPYGVSPTISLKIGYVEVDYQSVFDIELLLEENKHDLVVIKLAGIPPKYITEYYGKPVELFISTGPYYVASFHGYVTEVRPHSYSAAGLMNSSPFQEAEVVCVGVSYGMRGQKSKVWSGYSLTNIAKELADKHQFSLDVPPLPVIHETLAQTDESDWQFLVRYSNMLGYSVNAHGTHIHIYDPYNAVSRGVSSTRLMALTGSKGYHAPHPGQILEFKGNFGKRHADGQYMDTVVTVITNDNGAYDFSTRYLTGTVNGPAEYTDRIHNHSDTFSQASSNIERRRRQYYDYYADVVVIGAANCKPGGIVNVEEFGGEFDGLWYVKSAKHHVDDQTFITSLHLARNINSQLDFTDVARIGEVPLPVYRDERWVSPTHLVREYV
jgi:phage protein D